MNAARRRFIQRTLGVVGYIAGAVAVVPVAGVGSLYAYRGYAAYRFSAAESVVENEIGVAASAEPSGKPELPDFLTDEQMDALEARSTAVALKAADAHSPDATPRSKRTLTDAEVSRMLATGRGTLDPAPASAAAPGAPSSGKRIFTDEEIGRLEAAERASKRAAEDRDAAGALLLTVALLSLAPLTAAAMLLWARHFLALAEVGE